MNITVNGTPVMESYDHALNLEEIIVHLSKNAVPENHLVGSVRVNGNDFSELYPGQAKDVGRDRIQDLALQTVSFELLSQAAMKDCPVLIDRIMASANKTADMFRMHDESEAFEHFGNLIESLRSLFLFIDAARKTMDIDGRANAGSGTSADEAWERLRGIIDEMKNIQEEGDLILLADLLEYELVPALQTWSSIFSTDEA